MQLMIPYRHGLDDGVEMMYALRSIEQNFRPLDGSELELAIVGDLPSWCSPETYLEWSNPTPYPALNVSGGLIRLAQHLQEQGVREAVYLDDDYFLLYPQQTVLATHYGSFRKMAMSVYRSHDPAYNYYRVVKGTEDLLAEDALWFEGHSPLPLTLEDFVPVLGEAQAHPTPGVAWRSLYGNRHLREIAQYVPRDGRIHMTQGFTPGVPWISSEDSAWVRKFGRILSAMFTVPSKWEKR